MGLIQRKGSGGPCFICFGLLLQRSHWCSSPGGRGRRGFLTCPCRFSLYQPQKNTRGTLTPGCISASCQEIPEEGYNYPASTKERDSYARPHDSKNSCPPLHRMTAGSGKLGDADKECRKADYGAYCGNCLCRLLALADQFVRRGIKGVSYVSHIGGRSRLDCDSATAAGDGDGSLRRDYNSGAEAEHQRQKHTGNPGKYLSHY